MEGVNALWAQPLATVPGSPANQELSASSLDRPNQGFGEPSSVPFGSVIPLPSSCHKDKNPGGFACATADNGRARLVKGMTPFQDDGKAAPPLAERYVGTLFTKAGDEVLHKYVKPTATPSTPKEERFRIQGVRTPGGGYGKGLLRPLTASEKEGAAESRSPPPMKVKRHLTPPPIVRAPGQFVTP